jgi:hypothetical protein
LSYGDGRSATKNNPAAARPRAPGSTVLERFFDPQHRFVQGLSDLPHGLRRDVSVARRPSKQDIYSSVNPRCRSRDEVWFEGAPVERARPWPRSLSLAQAIGIAAVTSPRLRAL